MKSVIPMAIQETFVKHFGEKEWPLVLKKAGFDPDNVFYGHRDTPDEKVVALLGAIMELKSMSMKDLSDAFGDHWVNHFAAKHYFAFYQRARNAKEFILKMNEVHDKIGSKVDGSKPPKFTFEEKPDGSLEMGYISDRNLIDLVIGLVKGVGKKFNETIHVTKLSESLLKLKFEG